MEVVSRHDGTARAKSNEAVLLQHQSRGARAARASIKEDKGSGGLRLCLKAGRAAVRNHKRVRSTHLQDQEASDPKQL
jgi:hypothetical protein